MKARVCCSLIAVLLCLSVYLSTTDAKKLVTAKPGVCPIYNLDGAVFIACLELCSRDGNCPNDEKCCSNGCGHQCMPPYKVKPGVCPRRFLGVGLCKGLCVNDIDCPKDEKCCSTKCGRKCTHPYKVRPGLCLKPNVC
ncbi:WAP four-disulfide core domain protein 3-like [Sinocyclocheilus anshuiensis]|uniref:WAP four-disulfide core domain protein 3-like n=1 Tax=Sinocyclocheilus anshuiensis TaxID=1608454 RepID=UPI0007B9A804|nr:PREDICTED: WAP four-disulfide core domain protein 3-like [Sinocyclocheilus anshuiensis]